MPATTRRSVTADFSRAARPDRTAANSTGTGRFSFLKGVNTIADFKVVCRGQEWLVHKAVLIGRSQKLKDICMVKTEYGELGSLELSNESVATVSALVDFLYDDDYDYNIVFEAPREEHDGPLAFQAKLLRLAESLDIVDMKTLAGKKTEANREDAVDMEDLALACSIAYQGKKLARPFCVRLVAYIVTNLKLAEDEDACPQLEKAMKDAPSLAIDIAKASQTMLDVTSSWQSPRSTEYRCPRCRRTFRHSGMSYSSALRCQTTPGCSAEYTVDVWEREHRIQVGGGNWQEGIDRILEGTWWAD